MLSPQEQALLGALIDWIMPADRSPSATGFGADAYILKMLGGDAGAAIRGSAFPATSIRPAPPA